MEVVSQAMLHDTIRYIDERIHGFCGARKEWIVIENEPRQIDVEGIDPFQRSVEELLEKGIVVIDKPPGPTSHEVVAWVKNMLGVKKAGHTGTLEPWKAVSSRRAGLS